MTLRLPAAGGGLEHCGPFTPMTFERPSAPLTSRRLLAAAHVVADPRSGGPGAPDKVDLDGTIAYRRHLWSWGLGVADVMDTAQRGMGLMWNAAKEILALSIAEARSCGGDLVCGVQTDHLAPGSAGGLRDIETAYEEQLSFVETMGGHTVVMASRELARIAKNSDDYRQVYRTVLSQLSTPTIIHWLGEVFDPALASYWGQHDIDDAMDVLLDVVVENAAHVDGIKLSLLDQERELRMRDLLPEGVRLYTGDDFDYPHLIRGDGRRHSDALLGALDVIAPAASTALGALDREDSDGFESILEPTVPLARKIFEAPTYHYKVGVTFVAYLNGHQDHFRMLDGLESERSIAHLAEVYRLTGQAGLFSDPERAEHRMRTILELNGVSAN
jgi:Protein of unknown function (DUF993)